MRVPVSMTYNSIRSAGWSFVERWTTSVHDLRVNLFQTAVAVGPPFRCIVATLDPVGIHTAADEDGRPQVSAVNPICATMGCQRCMSVRSRCASSSGVLGTTSIPISA